MFGIKEALCLGKKIFTVRAMERSKIAILPLEAIKEIEQRDMHVFCILLKLALMNTSKQYLLLLGAGAVKGDLVQK